MVEWLAAFRDAVLVFVGFLLAVLWDLIKTRWAWRGHRATLVAELESNRTALELRLEELPQQVREVVQASWSGVPVQLGSTLVAELPALSVPVGLKTSAWDSVLALGLLPRLRGNREVVATAYDQTVVANHFVALCFPLFEVSLNTAVTEETRVAFRQSSQSAAIYPLTYTLPAIRAALDEIG